jgi:DNA phosphorothioation-dependent restriction protein DptG
MMPDPGTLAEWVSYAVLFILALWRRRKQNETFASNVAGQVDEALAKEVAIVKSALNECKEETASARAAYSALAERVNLLDARMLSTNQRLDRFEEAWPRTDDLLGKVLNTLERMKAGALVEKPIEGSGGLVALKSKKEE